VSCGETIYNNADLKTQRFKPEQAFTIKCPTGCKEEDNRRFFGKGKYADKSPICITGMHSGMI